MSTAVEKVTHENSQHQVLDIGKEVGGNMQEVSKKVMTTIGDFYSALVLKLAREREKNQKKF